MPRCILYLLATISLQLLSNPALAERVFLAELEHPAYVMRDVDGVAHVRAFSEHDMFLLQGWVHARDRLFQMDSSRRQASGTLAELLGEAALPSDVELRTIGVRRAAERSWIAMQAAAAAGDSVSRRTVEAMRAYARGVNAYVAGAAELPPEYGALGLTTFEPWTALDSITIGKLIVFSLSFELRDIDRTVALQTFQAVLGDPLRGAALFAEDLFRVQPFDPAATVPDSGGSGPRHGYPGHYGLRSGSAAIDPHCADLARRYLDRVRGIPLLRRMIERDYSERGSNQWGVSSKLSATGNPIIASDPHLALAHPTTFYPVHIASPGYDAVGSSFAGAPFVITGQNRHITWGPTVSPFDVTDFFLDTLVPDTNSPSGLSILLPDGRLGPVVPVPESYRVNVGGTLVEVPPGTPGIEPVTLTVPDRYHGVILQFDPDGSGGGTAITVQYTGFGPTRELETFYAWNKARNLHDFRQGLQRFDVGSQNWAYADRQGNLAYFTSAEVPVRTDLETLGRPAMGIPPYFIRIGADPRHQWLTKINHYPGQTTPFEILSPKEMPQVVNPKKGYFVNANNDPLGFTNDNDPLNELRTTGGIYYLSAAYASGFRAGRITERLERLLSPRFGRVSPRQMADIQADVGLRDAQHFVPILAAAFAAARDPGADPALAAVAADPRLALVMALFDTWSTLDFQARTGIPEGYDAADYPGEPAGSLSADEINASIATTLYSVWRSSFIALTLDATLDAFPVPMPRPGSAQAMTALKTLVARGGVSISGVDFFTGGASDQATDVQVLLLAALGHALDRLASDEFAAAFGGSTNLGDYRWGKLHRITFSSPLGQPFSVPEAFGVFPQPLPGLAGIPTDGGFNVVDASTHPARGSGVDGFTFSSGPTNRWVSEVSRLGPVSRSVWPGGTSAIPGDPFYVFPMLPRWLTNDAELVRFRLSDILRGRVDTTVFRPRGSGRRPR